MHITYYHCAKDQIEKVLISRLKFILYDYFDSCLIFKTPITQNSKTTCLRTCGNDNSKSRYGNDLKFAMTFLDR